MNEKKNLTLNKWVGVNIPLNQQSYIYVYDYQFYWEKFAYTWILWPSIADKDLL